MLLDIIQTLSSPQTDRLDIFFIQYQARDVIISLQFIPKSVIIVVDVLFYGVILLDILSEVNQNVGGYDHYSYLFP